MERQWKKGNKIFGNNNDWNRTNSFMNKPEDGWLHRDEQLCSDAGVCYGVRYLGCLEVKESMRTLDFETRTNLAREAINRITEAAGLKFLDRKKKSDKKVLRILGGYANLRCSGSNITLTITTEALKLVIMENGKTIANHDMASVSFASGGDMETKDFVAYVAKDSVNGRACYVLECGGGLAESVITTIGQAFELRFKEYLRKQPKPTMLPEWTDGQFNGESWEDEAEYYNDRPNAMPPSPTPPQIPPLPNYSVPNSNSNVPEGLYSTVNKNKNNEFNNSAEGLLVDLSEAPEQALYDKPKSMAAFANMNSILLFDSAENIKSETDKSTDFIDSPQDPGWTNGALDPFDMQPFETCLLNESMTQPPPPAPAPEESMQAAMINKDEIPAVLAPVYEEWYHGPLNRKEAELLLEHEGDFLVRESTTTQGQFVLSGRHSAGVKHLLLIDPEGVVRTKDCKFDSISHLVNYHKDNHFPILTQGTELHLLEPVVCNK
ncbi:SHC-transforming protein 1 isoform X2 [Octopus bimaculoides]|uniref:SHC-transforming protein 1 n=1 Tax=Octopus bimaculoides TaxID=37653 RepID=A0A0L8HBM4_OCTBM|nr:SHC-transforming protein 1 isoform X2 [Octopus bimaculoides]|eukprot:XP_014774101.1 PREDICTED: SHC-transforming protein 1-like isoform X2 [Octopus bimaculoides]